MFTSASSELPPESADRLRFFLQTDIQRQWAVNAGHKERWRTFNFESFREKNERHAPPVFTECSQDSLFQADASSLDEEREGEAIVMQSSSA